MEKNRGALLRLLSYTKSESEQWPTENGKHCIKLNWLYAYEGVEWFSICQWVHIKWERKVFLYHLEQLKCSFTASEKHNAALNNSLIAMA